MSDFEADLDVGPRAIEAYSRLSYTMWHALAEFVDNSTQSRANYGGIIDGVLQQEGRPLVVEIDYFPVKREITINDNSIGMNQETLRNSLRIAWPTKDSKGRSKYGMGMKTAACWIGRRWKIVTCEWSRGEEWTAEIDIPAIVNDGARVPLTMRKVSTDDHYTRITISDLHRSIQARAEENIKQYLSSMYRFDLAEGRLKILYRGEEVKALEELEFDTDLEGKPMKRVLPPISIGGKPVTGWIAVLRKGGRKYGGFSLFQNKRQITGFPKAWKPTSIFGGEVDEGANNLISQRLMGVIELDGFDVSHTKDAILYEGDEENELEKYLREQADDYRRHAQTRRGKAGQPWSREKVRDLLEGIGKEFGSPEMKDAVSTSLLPPLDTILANNQQQVASLTPEEQVLTIDILPELRVVVWLLERSEFEPHLTIETAATPGTIHVVLNRLHPYYSSLESTEAADECMRQYIYDAVAEYRVSKLAAKVNPNSVRRLKDQLLRVVETLPPSPSQDTPAETVIGGNSTGA